MSLNFTFLKEGYFCLFAKFTSWQLVTSFQRILNIFPANGLLLAGHKSYFLSSYTNKSNDIHILIFLNFNALIMAFLERKNC